MTLNYFSHSGGRCELEKARKLVKSAGKNEASCADEENMKAIGKSGKMLIAVEKRGKT